MEKVRIQNTTSFDEVEQVVENDNLTDETKVILHLLCSFVLMQPRHT